VAVQSADVALTLAVHALGACPLSGFAALTTVAGCATGDAPALTYGMGTAVAPAFAPHTQNWEHPLVTLYR
jgi:hypothetical protein